jgi:intracellular sulfur oxidation DsrE/DsrF family protein
MTYENSPTNRRSFLGAVATGSAALAMSSVGVRSAEAAEIADGFSEAWLSKITGKHKQYFDATTTGQFPMVYAMNFLNSYNDPYKIPDSQLSAVVGLRHFAIGAAMKDSMWAKYKIGEFTQTMDPETKAPSLRNIFNQPHAGDIMFPGAAIEKLVARGVQFTACNVALTVVSSVLAKNAGVSAEAAKAEWTANLLPGVVLVPSGVLAVNRAQEKGCTYCSAG